MLIAVTAALAVTLLLPATSFGLFDFSTSDGSKVVFETSDALVGGDTDHTWDVYKRAPGGTMILVSQGEINGNGPIKAFFEGASSDASTVFFRTAERLARGDIDGSTDIYKRAAGRTILVSTSQAHPNGSFEASYEGASTDGSKVLFSTAEQLVGADTDHSVDIYERSGGATTLVSKGQINGNGAFDALLSPVSCQPVGHPTCGDVTGDGSKVFFTTAEQLVGDDTDNALDVYERAGGSTTLVSRGQINGNGATPALFDGASADGSKVFFETDEKLVSGDADTFTDVYERAGGSTTEVSRGPTTGDGSFPYFTHFGGATSDGSKVWFYTREPLVGADADTAYDVYQRSAGTTTLISRGQVNGNGDFDAVGVLANSDGSRVFFETDEPLVAGDVNNVLDTYERFGGKTIWVTQGPVSFTGPSHGAPISAIANDGATAFFATDEPLVSADTDSAYDVYQRAAGKTTLLSKGQINGNGGFDATFGGASSDGSKVFFETEEELVPGAPHGGIYERSGGATKLISG
jgi:hypothetical protein